MKRYKGVLIVLGFIALFVLSYYNKINDMIEDNRMNDSIISPQTIFSKVSLNKEISIDSLEVNIR